MRRPPYDAVVLAGARSERLGGADKPMVDVGGAPMLERVLAGLLDAGHVTVVGPSRTLSAPLARAIAWCEEDPPGGGPVAALAAGLTTDGTAPVVVVLAADLPFVTEGLPALREALDGGPDVAVLVDRSGRVNYLAAAWRRPVLERAVGDGSEPAGRSMRSLLAGVDVVEVPDDRGWGTDCDTWESIEQARERVRTSGAHDRSTR